MDRRLPAHSVLVKHESPSDRRPSVDIPRRMRDKGPVMDPIEIDIRTLYEFADYTSSEARYTLESCPGERVSGLQLMCLMYAGFQRFAPDQDTGMDLREPFLAALQMHQAKRDDGGRHG